MIKRDYLIVLLIFCGAIAYFALPTHRADGAIAWWQRWFIQSQSNLLLNQRGLNVAVLGPEGELVEARSFDTYLQKNSGFSDYVSTIPKEYWVVIAAQDDAATSLSQADRDALQTLGGTDALAGKYHWAYILVGRPQIDRGKGLESFDQRSLDLRLEKGQTVAGIPLPAKMRVRSAGFSAGSYATLQSNYVSDRGVWFYWVVTAFKRS